MAIIASCSADAEGNWPEGAWINIEAVYDGTEPYEYSYTNAEGAVISGTGERNRVVGWKPQVSPNHVLCHTHVGLVLSLGEDNGYDDSDFWAIVWDPQKGQTERITYASTRGWTYDLGASIDATDEVKAAYAAKQAYDRRRWIICDRRGASKMRAEYARKFGVRMSAIRRLEAAYGRLNPVRIASAPSYYNAQSRALSISFGLSREPEQIDRVLQLGESFVANRLRNAFKKKLAEQVVAWLKDPSPQYATPLSKKQVQYV